jgi:hypothetical protein
MQGGCADHAPHPARADAEDPEPDQELGRSAGARRQRDQADPDGQARHEEDPEPHSTEGRHDGPLRQAHRDD